MTETKEDGFQIIYPREGRVRKDGVYKNGKKDPSIEILEGRAFMRTKEIINKEREEGLISEEEYRKAMIAIKQEAKDIIARERRRCHKERRGRAHKERIHREGGR